MLSKAVRKILFLDNFRLKIKILRKRRKKLAIHELNKFHSTKSEFSILYKDLRKNPPRFFQFLRMSISTFDHILSKVKHRLEKKTTNFKKPISAEERLYITLRYLSTGNSFKNLSATFRIGVSTTANIVHETCKALWEELVGEYMPVPTEEKLKQIANDYYKRWKFPNCIGAIDGKHCQIKCPPNSGSSYLNYMKYFSIVLQGVADADKKFICIEVGARGKQSDGGTFASSDLFKILETKELKVPSDCELPGTNIKVPFFLIGDEAYPLKPFLMRPFPSKKLNKIKENFNTRLSTARKCIECAFGILRAKWRILGKDLEVHPKKAEMIIKCVCVLHNVIRTLDGDSDLDYYRQTQSVFAENSVNITQEVVQHGGRRRNPTLAEQTRDSLANYFLHF